MIYTGQTLQVGEAVSLINETLSSALPAIIIEGEVSSFKVSKNKWVFFDIKDEDNTINCFMPVFSLGVSLKDGMKVKVLGIPKLTQWGRFSLTIKEVVPVGEGSINKAYAVLKKKLESEGLFEASRKRELPEILQNIAVISSAEAAGWKDFQRIFNDRWVGIDIAFANVQVQGLSSPGQITKAIDYINKSLKDIEAIVIIRGGGSIEDLAGFNDERLVRAISSSRLPVVVGVGHETDETLASLVADVNAATPTHAATIITPDKEDFLDSVASRVRLMSSSLKLYLDEAIYSVDELRQSAKSYFETFISDTNNAIRLLEAYSPQQILNRGYAVLRGVEGGVLDKPGLLKEGESVIIEASKHNITTKVKSVKEK